MFENKFGEVTTQKKMNIITAMKYKKARRLLGEV